MRLSERHLGLVPARELDKDSRAEIRRAARTLADQIDIDRLVGLTGTGELPIKPLQGIQKVPMVKIGVALDESFNFYYQDNLDALRRQGTKLEYFSPVSDPNLPEGIHGVMVGGGFPEVLADRLAGNIPMMKSLRKGIEGGLPVYAECGGLMYLTRSIRGYKDHQEKWKMIGLIDAETAMTGALTLNYTEGNCSGPLFGWRKIRGHEFHYSVLESLSSDTRFAYQLSRGKGIFEKKDGIVLGDNALASYTHLHFATKGLAERLVAACISHSRR
jgi:cobyrinic acid a,c-diamide synthase